MLYATYYVKARMTGNLKKLGQLASYPVELSTCLPVPPIGYDWAKIRNRLHLQCNICHKKVVDEVASDRIYKSGSLPRTVQRVCCVKCEPCV